MSTKGCLAVAVAGLAAALPATSAADFNQGTANGITYINDQTSVPAGQASAPAAECLPGSHLIGAAADSLDTVSAGILSSLRADDDNDGNATPDDGATAFTHNTTGAGAGSFVWASAPPARSATRHGRRSSSSATRGRSRRSARPGRRSSQEASTSTGSTPRFT